MKPNEKLAQLYTQEYILEEYSDPYVPVKQTFFSTSTPLDELQSTALGCHLCSLSKGRTSVIFGQGAINASLMIVGEWPSQDDDKSGIPLGGKTRETLTTMIEKVLNLTTHQVYFTTLVKCKPALANNPSQNEQDQCFAYLEGEINAIRPRVIMTLGEAPFRALTSTTSLFENERGTLHHYDDIPLIPTFHPNFLARNPSERSKTYEDLLKVKSLLSALTQ